MCSVETHVFVISFSLPLPLLLLLGTKNSTPRPGHNVAEVGELAGNKVAVSSIYIAETILLVFLLVDRNWHISPLSAHLKERQHRCQYI